MKAFLLFQTDIHKTWANRLFFEVFTSDVEPDHHSLQFRIDRLS